MKNENNKSVVIAIIAMMFLFAMISFVTNMAAPFGTIWKFQYSWAGMMGNMMNFAAYLFMGIPAGIMISKMGYKKTVLVGLARRRCSRVRFGLWFCRRSESRLFSRR